MFLNLELMCEGTLKPKPLASLNIDIISESTDDADISTVGMGLSSSWKVGGTMIESRASNYISGSSGIAMFTLRTTNVYVMHGPEMLLIRRSQNDDNKPSWWESPAGHVDIPCEPLDTMKVRKEALRELFEETGISADPYLLEHLPRFSSSRHMCYILNLKYIKPKVTLSDEHDSFVWHNVKEKTPPQTRYEVRRFLRDTYNV